MYYKYVWVKPNDCWMVLLPLLSAYHSGFVPFLSFGERTLCFAVILLCVASRRLFGVLDNEVADIVFTPTLNCIGYYGG